MASRKRISVILLILASVSLLVFSFKNESTESKSDAYLFSMLCHRDVDGRVVLRRMIVHGEAYVAAICPPDINMLSLPSGSAVYVFNSSGYLIDSTGDVGDNPKFAAKWSEFSSGELMDKRKLTQLIQECNSRIIFEATTHKSLNQAVQIRVKIPASPDRQ